jgi:uncharacterized protein YdaT
MPWTSEDAMKHTKKANTAKKQSVWAEIANKVLSSGDSEGSAIRQANAAVARMGRKSTAMSR